MFLRAAPRKHQKQKKPVLSGNLTSTINLLDLEVHAPASWSIRKLRPRDATRKLGLPMRLAPQSQPINVSPAGRDTYLQGHGLSCLTHAAVSLVHRWHRGPSSGPSIEPAHQSCHRSTELDRQLASTFVIAAFYGYRKYREELAFWLGQVPLEQADLFVDAMP